MIKAVLFDMDGTVFDTERIYYACWEQAARELHFPGNISELLPLISGTNRADTCRFFQKAAGEEFPAEELFSRRVALTTEALAKEGLSFRRGAPEVFPALRRLGMQLALATSTNAPTVKRYLSEMGLSDTFDLIITGEQVVHSKPQPDIFLLCAEKLGISPDECVVVEDSQNGVRAGIAAGMRTVMIPDMQPCTEELRQGLWRCLSDLDALAPEIERENRT